MIRYLFYLIVFVPIVVVAEGTKQLRPNETDFGYINLMDQQNNLGTERTFALYNAPEDTRLNIRIKDPANEQIHLGFKLFDTDPLYFRIVAPDGSLLLPQTLVPAVDGNPGRIIDYDEAVRGPSTIDPNGYLPITVTPTMAGDYSLEFYDPAHNPPGTYAKRQFELFDVTVENTTTNSAVDGRLWSKSWDITTRSLANPFDSKAYIYTNDGITTAAQFQDFAAWSFIIQSNSTGPGTSGDVLIDRQSIDGGILLPEYKIFLNEPDEEEFPVSAVPSITGVPEIETCAAEDEYCITIEISNPGVIEYVIDVDGAEGFDHARDVKLLKNTTAGTNCLPWDGKDGNGNDLTTNDTFDIILAYQAGVTHLFIHDAENNPSGFEVEHISPAVGLGDPFLFYDDTQPAVGGSSDLVGCSTDCHSWTGNYGDNKTINTWWVTFFENDTIKDVVLSNSSKKHELGIALLQSLDCDGAGLQLAALEYTLDPDAIFAWYINGDSITEGQTFTSPILSNGDEISLRSSSDEVCTEGDTVNYQIFVPSIPLLSADAKVCENDSFFVTATHAGDSLSWWNSADEFLTNDTIYRFLATSSEVYRAEVKYSTPTINLVPNAGFENGFIGFTSDYQMMISPPVNLGPGELTISTSGADGNPGIYNMLADHTSSSGNLLIVNGATSTRTVYETSIAVIANVEYNFSVWLANLNASSSNNAVVEFYVDGQLLGEQEVAELDWTSFSTSWKASTTGVVDLTITSKSLTDDGNDFALDDISFGPTNMCADEVAIEVEPLVYSQASITGDSIFCEGDSAFLSVVDTLHLGQNPNYFWLLSGDTLNSTSTPTFGYLPSSLDTLVLYVYSDAVACVVKESYDTLVIQSQANPEIELQGDSTLCEGEELILTVNELTSSSTITISWETTESFTVVNGTSIASTPLADAVYFGYAVDENMCVDTVEFNVEVVVQPQLSLSPDSLCEGESTTLSPSLIPTTGVFTYEWQTGNVPFATSTDITVSPSTSTKYFLRVTDENNCRDSVTVEVSVFSQPELSLVGDSICEGESATLSPIATPTIGIFTYEWQTGNVPFATSADVTVSPTTTTEYYLLVEGENNCRDSTTVEVAVFTQPELSLVGDSICEGESATLSPIATPTIGIFTYEWQTGNVPFATSTDVTVSPTASTEYYLMVKGENNCKDSAFADVHVFENPQLSIDGGDVCDGKEVQLTSMITTSASIVSYDWLPTLGLNNSTSASVIASPASSTNYTLTVVDEYGCNANATTTVGVTNLPQAIILQDDTLLCEGESTRLNALTAPSYSYEWHKRGASTNELISDQTQVNIQEEGSYFVIVTNGGFCPVQSEDVIVDFEYISVEASASHYTIYEGESSELIANVSEDVLSVQWTGQNFSSTQNPVIVRPIESAFYTVVALGEKCSGDANIEIEVLPNIIIPNGFSPNGDGSNDAWYIKEIEAYTEAEVTIYNRWGSVVYTYKNGYIDPWPGINENGELLPSATYYYVIELNDIREQSFHGSVSLLR